MGIEWDSVGIYHLMLTELEVDREDNNVLGR